MVVINLLDTSGAVFGHEAMVDFVGIVCMGEGICRAYQ